MTTEKTSCKTSNPSTPGTNPSPLPPRSWQRLETAGDCRRFFRWLLLEVKRGKVDLKRANCLTFIGCSLLRAIEVSDLESKILALEAEQAGQHDRTIHITVGGGPDETA